MKTIGIIGGLGPESTAAFYQAITRDYYRRHADYAYPEILIHSLPFSEIIDAGYRLAGRIEDSIRRLAAAGADFVVAACNSIHIVYDEVAPGAPVPWVSIMDAVAEKVRQAGIDRAALLGTEFTMRGDFYQKAFSRGDLEVLLPGDKDRETVNRIIYDELVTGETRESSRQAVVEAIRRLGETGAKGVILGCTELPFLIRPEDVEMPVFDSTQILALKALAAATE